MNAAGQLDVQSLAFTAATQLIDAGRFSYASIKPDLTFDQIDGGVARMIGIPGETIAGRPVTDLLWEFVGLEPALREVLRGRRRQIRLEHINREQSNGSIRYHTFLVTPFDQYQPGIGLLLLVEDTTDYGQLHQNLVQDRNELRLVRETLAAANDELERLSRMKSFFVSMAAHDLRGPLTSILNFAAFLREDISESEQLEFLEIIVSQSDRMRRLIDDLLDFDQIEQGVLHLDWGDCNLNQIIEGVLVALRPSSNMRRQSIIANLPTQPYIIQADSNRLSQIVYNLMDNAVKFTPDGGTVRISLRPGQYDVEMEVADNGRGIAEDQINNIFSLYTRSPEIRRSKVPGSGLGLYIVKTLVEAHQGQIFVASILDQGTTFTVRLPNNQNRAA